LVKVGDYEVPEDLCFSEDYIWVRVEGEKVRIGFTDFGQKNVLRLPAYNSARIESANDIAVVELPSKGSTIKQKEPFGDVESVKSVFELFAAVSGVVDQVNEKVVETPELINKDPYGEGWLIVVSPNNLNEELKSLMNFDAAVEWHKKQIL
jgi:glycine cleavage system H protein